MALRILHTNDMHGVLRDGVFERLRSLRDEADAYFDTGDCIKTGNLGIPLKPEPAWQYLAQLRCDASVPGNRESHVLEGALGAKLAGHEHPILCANMRRKDGSAPLPPTLVIERAGVRMGLFGVMVPMVTPRMATRIASAYLWDPPIQAAKLCVDTLRPLVDVLIALTHIGHKQDLLLAEQCPEIDVIFGGHSHTVVPTPQMVGRTAICQGGSHLRYAGVYTWDAGHLTGGLVPLNE